MGGDGLYREALVRFEEWLARARQAGLREPTAMALATADAQGRPSVRMVLLKGADERGFVFYTNLESRKGRQLSARPWAALGFYWDPLARQVIVEGGVEPVSAAEADAYWGSRPRESRIGGWASLQSRPLESREVLERRVEEAEAKYKGGAVPRPPHWAGYRVVPERIEFWEGRPGRLHERLLYERPGGLWRKGLLYP
jgi:pyridoxamine 5'-phosphate oxidase